MRRPLTLLAIAALLITSAAAVNRYTIRRGDTLGGVARRLGVSVDALARANGIKNRNRIPIGKVLVVPATATSAKKSSAMKSAVATKPASGAAKPAAAAPAAPKPIVDVHVIPAGLPPIHVVANGETAKAIASHSKVSVANLTKANPGVNLNKLTPGMALKLPLSPVWICPVQGPHTWRDDWGAFRADTGSHQGNDILAPRGTPVVAPVGGTLELKQGTIGGNAFYVRGDDGNSYYGAHLDRYVRGPGRIEAGQQIGVVGDTGDAKGGATHLHFEFHPNNGPAVDPFFTLEAWC